MLLLHACGCFLYTVRITSSLYSEPLFKLGAVEYIVILVLVVHLRGFIDQFVEQADHPEQSQVYSGCLRGSVAGLCCKGYELSSADSR